MVYFSIGLLTGLVFCMPSVAQEPAETPVTKLVSKDFKERQEAEKQILDERKKMIEKLIDIIHGAREKRSDDDSVKRAMTALGEIRAVEAVDILARHIAFPEVKDWPHFGPMVHFSDAGRTTRQLYPAVDALIKIGEPCIPSLVEMMARTDSVIESGVCQTVLLALRTLEQAEAVLQGEIGREKDSLRKKRLQLSLDDIRRKAKAGKSPTNQESDSGSQVPAR